MEKETPQSEQSAILRAAVKTAKIVGMPLTAVTAWFTGDVMVRNSLYKNFSQHGFFDGKIRSTGGVQGKYSNDVRQAVRDTYEQKIADAATTSERSRLVNNAKKYNVIPEEQMPSVLRKLKVDASTISKATEKTVPSITEHPATKTRVEKLLTGYRREIREFFDDIDMKNMRDWSEGITRNQKTEAVMFSVSAAAVTLGATFAIMQYGKERQEQLRDEKETDTPRSR